MSDRVDKITEKSVEVAALAKLQLYQTLSKRILNGDQLTPTELKTYNDLDRKYSADPKDAAPPEYFDNYRDAVAYLGVSKRTLEVNIKKGNIRQEPDGTFKKSELDGYLEKYGKKSAKARLSDLEQQKLEADVRFRTSRAMREELLYKQLRGEYLSKKQVHTGWASRLGVLCSSLENLADRLPPILFKKSRSEMFELIRTEVDEMRSVLCQGNEYCPDVNRKRGRPRKGKR